MSSLLFQIATWLVPLTIAIVFHEVAHGRMALALGDRTAQEMGRLSLNPIRHIDPFGTLILPLMLAVSGAPIFGWAKPVPYNPARLRNPRWGSVLVAAAGPLSNIVLALLVPAAILLLLSALDSLIPIALYPFITANIFNFVAINIFLAVFNMIPLPPFDGSKVLAGFLPAGVRDRFIGLDRYALLIMIMLLLVLPRISPSLDVIGNLVQPPVRHLTEFIVFTLSLALS